MKDVAMKSEDLASRVQELRAAGSTPKQIAHTLGIPRSKAVALVHSGTNPRPDRGGDAVEKQLIGCWVTRQWSNGLTIEDRPSDWIDDDDLPPLAIGAGLPSVAVVREHAANEVSVCGFLVDTYCQGVKNAVPPHMMDRRELSAYLAHFFSAYERGSIPAPIELAQNLVLGAVEYAQTLGFDPSPDFYLAKPHLGAWQPPGRIQFGLDGEPYFQQGPYDNPIRVMRTLDKSVGRGNYGFFAEATIDGDS
jgi:hypothetical protein